MQMMVTRYTFRSQLITYSTIDAAAGAVAV